MALYLVIRVSALLSRVIPRSWRYLVSTVVGDLVYYGWPAKRRIILANMATVLSKSADDPQVRRVAVKSMRNYCKYLIEFLELPVVDRRDPVVRGMKIEGADHLRAAVADGKGVIVVSGHFGTLELAGLRLQDFADFHAVYDSFSPPYLDRLIQRKRLEKGIDLIPVNGIRRMLRVLAQGGMLVMLFDRPVDASKGTPVSFCGRETAVPGGPAVLALKTGATLLPIYVTREPDNSLVSTILPPVTWTATGDRDYDVRAIMQKLMHTLQSAVVDRPDQWYMFRAMWPERVSAAVSGVSEAAIEGPSA